MIKFVKFLRDAFITILALFSAFVAGILFGGKAIEKGVDAIFADNRRKPRSKVSYRSFYDRKDEG